MPSQKKIQIVSSLVDLLSSNVNFVIVDFSSDTHQAMEKLRKILREKSARLKVVKNSLLKVTLAKVGKKDLVAMDTAGKTAIMTVPEDWNEALSSFFKFARETEFFSFKIGILGRAIYDQAHLEKLALLPSRSELAVKIIMSLRTPQTRMVYAMNYNMQKLTYVLRNIKN